MRPLPRRRSWLPAMILALSACGGDDATTVDAPIPTVDGAPGAPDARGGPPDGGGAVVPSTIVPLYSYPTETPWADLAAAQAAHPDARVVAIVNPDNGPGAVFDPHYGDGLELLQAAGVTVIGYVYTSYTGRAAAVVEDDIDAWGAFYPSLEGIFFDEMSSDAGDVAYYADLSAYADAAGMTFTVGNPGTDIDPAFVGSVDVLLVYETAGAPPPGEFTGTWHADHHPDNFGLIPYAVSDPAGLSAFRPTVSWIYATDDDLPNPWDTLPAYFPDLLK